MALDFTAGTPAQVSEDDDFFFGLGQHRSTSQLQSHTNITRFTPGDVIMEEETTPGKGQIR